MIRKKQRGRGDFKKISESSLGLGISFCMESILTSPKTRKASSTPPSLTEETPPSPPSLTEETTKKSDKQRATSTPLDSTTIASTAETDGLAWTQYPSWRDHIVNFNNEIELIQGNSTTTGLEDIVPTKDNSNTTEPEDQMKQASNPSKKNRSDEELNTLLMKVQDYTT